MNDARRKRLEWPTLVVAGAVYAGFGLLTAHYHSLPWWLLLPAGAYLLTLHGSLQHEVVHGHPTPWPWVNRALVFPSLWLWLPLEIYSDAHLRHHRDSLLTDPLEDPESYYLTGESWARAGRLRRAALVFHNTSLGRLLMGPLVSVIRLAAVEGRAFVNGDFRHAAAWLVHLAACAVVLYWVMGVCGIPLGEYLLLFVYPGISLTLLRSFAEHRAHPDFLQRVATVESGPLMSLLYLNNNLHLAHHREPGVAWYALPARWRAQRAELMACGIGYRYSGYGEIIRRFLLAPREPVPWPLEER